MAPEYGATMGFFPVDAETVWYLRATGRTEEQVRGVRELFQGAGALRHPAKRRDRLQRRSGTRPRDGAPERLRAEAAAGSHRAARRSRRRSARCSESPCREGGYGKPEASTASASACTWATADQSGTTIALHANRDMTVRRKRSRSTNWRWSATGPRRIAWRICPARRSRRWT